MAIQNGLVIGIFVAIATSIALGYGYGVKAGKLPFSVELGFNEEQLTFISCGLSLLPFLAF